MRSGAVRVMLPYGPAAHEALTFLFVEKIALRKYILEAAVDEAKYQLAIDGGFIRELTGPGSLRSRRRQGLYRFDRYCRLPPGIFAGSRPFAPAPARK